MCLADTCFAWRSVGRGSEWARTSPKESAHERDRRRLPTRPSRVGLGCEADLRLPRRRHQRDHRRVRPRARPARVHPGSPRGDGRVHGVRARQVHRRGRRVPRDLGPGSDPPAQRPVRREARPSAGRRDRRPAGPARPRRQLPARGRPDDAVQGRRPRVRADGERARPGSPPDRPRDADRAVRAHRHLRDRAQRPADGTGRADAAARARHRSLRPGLHAAAGRRPTTSSCATPRRCSTPARRSRC